ncbi:MAG: T9SS type A sorting domain-containing protein [Bacteroidia bacterium]
MKKLILLVCVVSAIKIIAQPANTGISNSAVFGGEPYLAVNPTNTNNIVIAWMALDASTGYKMAIKTKVSFDGGSTWGNQHIKQHVKSTYHSADVSMQFRNNGVVYLSYIDSRQNPDSGGILITHSTDGGISWQAVTQAWDGNTEDPGKLPIDRPWLKADNSSSPSQGTLYMTTKPPSWISMPNRSYLKHSADSGQTWSSYRYVDTVNYLIGPSIAAPMAALAVAADGALCLAYPSYVTSQSPFPKFFFAKSYNKGGTFTRNDLLVNPSSVANSNYKLAYTLAANPNNSNQLAFCTISNQNGDPDIYITTTNNGGTSWSVPVRVNDDITGNGKAQDLAWISYSKNNRLLAVWRDKRNGAGTGFYQPSDVYCSISNDNGATFLPNIRLSNVSVPHDTILTQDGNDFLSCELVSDTIYAAWGDVRTGKLNIYFAKTAISNGTGIKPVIINNEDVPLSLYPNPARDRIILERHNPDLKMITVFIYDDYGKLVLRKELTEEETQIDAPGFKEGVYILKAVSGRKIILNQKFLFIK